MQDAGGQALVIPTDVRRDRDPADYLFDVLGDRDERGSHGIFDDKAESFSASCGSTSTVVWSSPLVAWPPLARPRRTRAQRRITSDAQRSRCSPRRCDAWPSSGYDGQGRQRSEAAGQLPSTSRHAARASGSACGMAATLAAAAARQ